MTNPETIEEWQDLIKEQFSNLKYPGKIEMGHMLTNSIPVEHDRIKQTMQTFLSEAEKGDQEALDLAIEHISGYWAKYNHEHRVRFFSGSCD